MGRWSYLDSDEERLPEGMTRIGYDADTQTYTYSDESGKRWEGAPGCRYGVLQPISKAAPALPSAHVRGPSHVNAPSVTTQDEASVEWFSDTELPTPEPNRAETAPKPKRDATVLYSTNKPLPPLPDACDGSSSSRISHSTTSSSADLHKLPFALEPSVAPIGEEHRYKRQQARQQKQTVKRSGTLKKLARILGVPASPADQRTQGSVRRAATVRGRGGEHGTGSRKRAETFDEILAPPSTEKQ